MTTSKRMIVLFFSILMVSSTFILGSEANAVNYAAINRDGIPCDPKNRQNCKLPPQANRYRRGCSPITRCRND